MTSEGVVYGWGWNGDGQAGFDTPFVNRPTLVDHFDSSVKFIQCNGRSSFALTHSGHVFSWGSNQYNTIGHNVDRVKHPTKLDLIDIVEISLAMKHSYFLDSSGQIHYTGRYTKPGQIELIEHHNKINSLSWTNAHLQGVTPVLAIINSFIYEIFGKNFTMVNRLNRSVDRYYSREHQLTRKCVNINKQLLINQVVTKTASKTKLENISTKIEKVSSYRIEKIFAFDDEKGGNILMLTEDNNLIGIGSNWHGQLGLGHGCIEDDFVIIMKNIKIKQIKNGENFVIALDNQGYVYGWV